MKHENQDLIKYNLNIHLEKMQKSTTKIAFVGNYEYHCGSSNTLLGYVKAGKKINCDIRASEFSYLDDTVRASIPVADKSWKPDLLIIVYESYPFLSEDQINQICSKVPRSRRLVVDPDGKYSFPITHRGDTNHPNQDSYRSWTNLYDSLSDIILQPFIDKKSNGKVYPFLFFGIDSNLRLLDEQVKDFDLLYVGNNWHRWHDIEQLIKIIAPIRSQLNRIAIIGRYWDDEVMGEFKEATVSHPELLKENNIEIHKSAPYDQVEKTMSRGKLHPIFIRPILEKLEFVTPRMFETLLADTVPLIPSYFSYAPKIYGEEIKQLTLSPDKPADNILGILDDYTSSRKVAKKIRESLKERHSYETRLRELLRYVS